MKRIGAISLPRPGSTTGPCEEWCEHTDCNETRRTATSICTICGQPIGYARRFFAFSDGSNTHALCLTTRDDDDEGGQS